MIKNGLIVLLAIIAILLFNRPIKVKTVNQIDTVITTKNVVKYTKGSAIFVRTIDTLFKVINDTAFIIKDYNQAKEYKDSIKVDSNLYVITDTINQNKIIGRSFEANIKEKTIYITNTVKPKEKAMVYLGYRGDISHDYIKVAHSINLHLKTRHRGLWSVGYGTNGYSLGYAFKLRL